MRSAIDICSGSIIPRSPLIRLFRRRMSRSVALATWSWTCRRRDIRPRRCCRSTRALRPGLLHHRMRSSPNFSVVNRRGIGIHVTFEQFSSVASPSFGNRGVASPQAIERRGTVYQEALAAATNAPSGASRHQPRSKIKNRKVLALAILSLIQGLVVVVNEVFDVVGALHFT